MVRYSAGRLQSAGRFLMSGAVEGPGLSHRQTRGVVSASLGAAWSGQGRPPAFPPPAERRDERLMPCLESMQQPSGPSWPRSARQRLNIQVFRLAALRRSVIGWCRCVFSAGAVRSADSRPKHARHSSGRRCSAPAIVAAMPRVSVGRAQSDAHWRIRKPKEIATFPSPPRGNNESQPRGSP